MGTRSISLDNIEEYIQEEFYLNLGEALGQEEDHPTRVVTVAILVLKNGYVLTGESSCADPGKYDRKMGEKIAKEKAMDKAWPLMGYVLKSQLAGMSGLAESGNHIDRLIAEARDLEGKRARLHDFMAAGMKDVPKAEQKKLKNQYQIMTDYLMVLNSRINNIYR